MKPGADDRELFRTLRRLAVRGAALVEEGSMFRFANPGGEPPAPGLIDGDLVRVLLSRDLVAANGQGGLGLSATGRAYLKRRLAGPDGFAAQHQTRTVAGIGDTDRDIRGATVNLDESPLAGLRRRKGRDGRPLLGSAEFAAGERFRADYSRAEIMPRVTANWTASVARGRRDGGAGGMAELTAAALDARRRVDQAIAAVGPDFAGLLIDFCYFLKGIEEIERDRQWPVRSAKLVLRLALASLARHYGLSAVARGAPQGGAMRHWGTDDYRPRIE